MRRHTVAWISCLALTSILLSFEGSQAKVGEETYPNLVPWEPQDLRVDRADGFDRPPPYALRFSVTVANRGEVPFDFEPDGVLVHGEDAIAAQCVKWVVQRVCTERRPAGRYVWHEAHGHYHIDDFAMYELRRVYEDYMPDMSAEGLVAGGQKVSFCMLDTTYDGAQPGQVQNPLYLATCGMGRQGISPGWADTYDWTLDGQQILLEGVPDGIYALVITVDPLGKFYEVTDYDNVSYTLLELRDDGTSVF